MQPTLYIPHGGGPCFFMEWTLGPSDTWDNMAAWLSNLRHTLPVKPDALLVVSAHWETDEFSVSANPEPDLIYDYYGFPEHTYELGYPASGNPDVAGRVAGLLGDSGIQCDIDDQRGLDHGVFIPFKLIYPDADIPIVQLSVKSNFDPKAHIEAGRTLHPLREENVLIVGSGLSSHNLAAMMRNDTELEGSDLFDSWLNDACADNADNRAARLIDWESAPAARNIHPREEHLIPLMVVAGAAGQDKARNIYSGHVMGAAVSAIKFG